MPTTTATLSHCTAQTGPTPAPSPADYFAAPPEPVIRSGPEMLARWIAALRSGQYKQARNQLRDAPGNAMSNGGDGFCCLGVLADLAVKDGLGAWATDLAFVPRLNNPELGGPFFDHADGRHSAPPYAITDRVLRRPYPGTGMPLQDELIDMNDQQRDSFETIANLLEESAIRSGILSGPVPADHPF